MQFSDRRTSILHPDQNKLARYIELLNIPARQGLNHFFTEPEKDGGNWYHYLLSLDLINENEYRNILSGKAQITPGRFIRSFVRQADRYYRRDGRAQMIVDFGCGWGFLSFWMAQHDDVTVYAIGYPWQIEFIEKINAGARQIGLFGNRSRVIPVASPLTTNSVTFANVIAPQSIDLVVMNDVIEHLHPSLYPNLAISAFNDLRSGGELVSKSHNTDNRAELDKLRGYWLSAEKNHLEAIRMNYILQNMRERPDDASELSLRTRGYTRAMVDSAVRRFLSTGNLPAFNPHAVPVDISIDDYMLENYVSPVFFGKYFSMYGFSVTSEPAMFGSRRSSVFAPLARLFPSGFLKLRAFSRTVVITAKKP